LKDADIRRAVVDELFRGPHVRDGSILVDCADGIVELTGTVDNLLAKDRAVAIAEGVKGVRAVSDRIHVEPVNRTDTAIVSDVRSALQYDPAARSYKIGVSGSNGTVRLSGVVQSWNERRLADRLARSVRGVRAVNDDGLTVTLVGSRGDADIQRDITSRLGWDTFLHDDPITVSVDKGRVRLSGVVGSAAEKSEAQLAGWVRGVTGVDGSGLSVEWWERDANARSQKYPPRTDAEIAAAVKDAMLYDPRVVSFEVKPTAMGGVVTLSGQVTSLKAKLAAESLARHTVGVMGVHNEIAVKAGPPISDQDLAKHVSSALAFDPSLTEASVDARAANGRVTLTGKVPTMFERAEALDVASSMNGVVSVDNQLRVSAPEVPFVWQSHVFPFGPYVEEWHYLTDAPMQSDKEIVRNINRELDWSPFVDATRVHVDVRGGKATLTGQVGSWSSRGAAEDDAFEGGAISVDNQLTVAG
jgi:osmotically-inducible protein OsmY